MKELYIIITLTSILVSQVKTQSLPTSSPDTEFVAAPSNNTVLEGSPAILKCKISQPIHTCQWFYLEPGLSFYDTSNTPVLVKEFQPVSETDCSIKFSKARRVQNGQWLCKGLNIQRRTYIISKPVYLKIMTRQEDMPKIPTTTPALPEKKNEIKFAMNNEGHLINTELSESVPLNCEVNSEIEVCSWITPSGKRISNATVSTVYEVSSNYSNGICGLGISSVKTQDEGNWRCVVTVKGEAGERLGPIIHLHLLEFGPHHKGSHVTSSDSNSRSSLIVPLVALSVLFVCLIVLLILIIYKKGPHLLGRKARVGDDQAPPPPEYVTDHTGTAIHKLDPSYSASYLSNPAIIQPSMQQEAAVPNHYTRYLDMTGNRQRPGSYVSFPASPFRSLSTATTATPVSSPTNSSFVGSSGQNSLTGSNRSFGNVSYDANPSMEPVPLYNASHLYEEIDEKTGRIGRRQSYPSEDPEGYMMPRSLNRAPIPPPVNDYQNDPRPTRCSSESVSSNRSLGSRPIEPPLPVRNDSNVNPLASYDVPTAGSHSDQDLSQMKSVFV